MTDTVLYGSATEDSRVAFILANRSFKAETLCARSGSAR